MHKASFAKNTTKWNNLATTVEMYAEELPHLQRDRVELVDALAAAQEAKHRQLVLRSAAAQATRDPGSRDGESGASSRPDSFGGGQHLRDEERNARQVRAAPLAAPETPPEPGGNL